jgi:hypothetical protein
MDIFRIPGATLASLNEKEMFGKRLTTDYGRTDITCLFKPAIWNNRILTFLHNFPLLDEIRLIIDACTNDILSRPDWDANIKIVDAVNSIRSEAL